MAYTVSSPGGKPLDGPTATLSRAGPMKPPKPQHLSSAFTGTLNSDAFREYVSVQAQKTGSSVASFSTGRGTPKGKDVWEEWTVQQAAKRAELEQQLATSRAAGGADRAMSPVQPQAYANLDDGMSTARFSTARSDLFTDAANEDYTATEKPKREAAPPKSSLKDLFNPPPNVESTVESWLNETSADTSSNDHEPEQAAWNGARDPEEEEEEGGAQARYTIGHDRFASATSRLTITQPDNSETHDYTTSHDRDESSATIRPASPAAVAGAHSKESSDSARKWERDGVDRPQQLPASDTPLERVSTIHSARTSIVSQQPFGAEPNRQIILRNGQGFEMEDVNAALQLSPVTEVKQGDSREEKRGDGGVVHTAPAFPPGRPARALFDIAGEAAFNELSLRAGECFEIISEELAGGWALAVVRGSDKRDASEQERMERHGLVPNGWYCYIQDFTAVPPSAPEEEPSSSSAVEVTPAMQDAQQALLTFPSSVVHPLSRQASDQANAVSSPSKAAVDTHVVRQAVLSSSPAILPTSSSQRISSDVSHAVGVLSAFRARHEPAAPSADPSKEDTPNEDPTPTPENLTNGTQSGWLFGGRSLNRFSNFVVSGVEEYLISGELSGEERTSLTQLQQSISSHDRSQHFVSSGSHGPRWRAKVTPFRVSVHSPQKHFKMGGIEEYTVFHVTSTFPSQSDELSRDRPTSESSVYLPYDPADNEDETGAVLTVVRRFNQFAWLATVLSRRYPALALPALPEKQYAGRFSPAFIETRKTDLQLWLSRITRHPVLRYDDALMIFLSEGDDAEWKKRAQAILSQSRSHAPASFFAQTWHPEFNFDAAEAAMDCAAMEKFEAANEKAINGIFSLPHNLNGSSGLISAWRALREEQVASSQAHKEISFALLRMIKGAHSVESLAQASVVPSPRGPPMGNVGKRGATGTNNEDGAWCWRENCEECIALTKALQGTAECMQEIAKIHEDHASTGMLRRQEAIKDVSRSHAQLGNILDIHKCTLAKYRDVTGEPDPLQDPEAGSTKKEGVSEAMAARCETVLNVTCSELDRVHRERVEDWASVGKSVLDAEIEKHEQILEQLRTARANYEQEDWYEHATGGPVLPSPYEAQLAERRTRIALAQPSQPVLPAGVAATAFRPVSLAREAITEGVTNLLRSNTSDSRRPSGQIGGNTRPAPTYHGTATIGRNISGKALDFQRKTHLGF